jgi:IS5 family transposase
MRAEGGHIPCSTVLIAKAVLLQQLYNLANDALEYQLLVRRSFLQFLNFTNSCSLPGAMTISSFRDRPAQAGVSN